MAGISEQLRLDEEAEEAHEAEVRAGGTIFSLGQAIPQIAEANHRKAVSDAVLAFLRGHFSAALITIVKGDMALGYRGFGGHFDDQSVESIVIPLSVPTMFQTAALAKQPYIGPPPREGHSIQERFFKVFPARPTEVVLLPVILRDRLVCMFYAHRCDGIRTPDTVFDQIQQVGHATEEAFLSLISGARKK
jgi:hypothetical protein